MSVFKKLTIGVKFQQTKEKATMDLFHGKSAIEEFQSDPDVRMFTNQSKLKAIEDSKAVEQSKEQQEQEKDETISFTKEDELNAFRNRLRIKVKGDGVPNPCPTFTEMELNKEMRSILLHNIELSKWKEPTPIQMQAIPVLLSQRDLLASAPTGSGKTGAYLIPLLSKLQHHKKQHGIRGLLLAPTKELADQIHRECERLCEGKKLKICNLKKNIMNRALQQQEKSVLGAFDILIATPLRLVSLIRADVVDLSRVELIILDEADKLLELDAKDTQQRTDREDNDEEELDADHPQRERSSFLQQMDEILAQCSNTSQPVQRALFSATIGSFVRELASAFLVNPIEVSIGVENSGASTIQQKLLFVGREDGKILAIRQLIQQGLTPPVLIFVQSTDRAKDLFKELVFDGINVDFMHAGRSAIQREEVIRRFRIGEIWVLICTDLMARGIDFKGVQMVINYDLPLTPVSYIHRIGRTGRAGRTGQAITFFTEQDIPRIRPIANVMKLSGCEVPEWMLRIKQLTTKKKRILRKHAPNRRRVGAASIPWEEGSVKKRTRDPEAGEENHEAGSERRKKKKSKKRPSSQEE